MVTFVNGAATGVEARTVTAANSGGSGDDAFGNVTIETSMANTTVAAAAYRGGFGYWLRGTVAARSHVGLRTSALTTQLRTRGYIYVRQYLGIQFIQFLGTGGATAGIFGYIQMDSTGHLFVINSGGTNLGTKSQPAVPQNTWCRLDIIVVPSATSGRIYFEVYEGEETTPFITYDVTSAFAANVSGWNWGKVNGAGIWTNGIYLDEIAADDLTAASFIGPVDTPEADPTTRSIEAAQSDGTDWIAIDQPAGVATGDQLLMFHVGDDAAPTIIDDDAGHTVTATVLDSGNSDSSAIVQTKTWLRKYDGTEPNPLVFHFGAFVDVAAGVMAIKGADPTTPIRAQAVATGAGTSLVAPSVAGAVAGDLLVCVWYIRTDGTARGGNAPASMREKADVQGTWASFIVATEKVAANGATGTRTATFPISASYRAVSLVFRPASTALNLLYLGSGAVQLYLGSTPVDAVYLGSSQVWP